MDATTAEPMEELLLDLHPEAIEQPGAMAAAQGCTVDELAQRLIDDGLKGLDAEQAEVATGGCPLPLS